MMELLFSCSVGKQNFRQVARRWHMESAWEALIFSVVREMDIEHYNGSSP